MEVAEEDMRDIDRVDTCFHHPVICSGALVEQEGVATDLDHIAGAHALERRCRSASAEQGNFHDCLLNELPLHCRIIELDHNPP